VVFPSFSKKNNFYINGRAAVLSLDYIYIIPQVCGFVKGFLKSFSKIFSRTNVRDFTPSDFPPHDSYAPLALAP
jgi:hypothetical protein